MPDINTDTRNPFANRLPNGNIIFYNGEYLNVYADTTTNNNFHPYINPYPDRRDGGGNSDPRTDEATREGAGHR